MKKLQVSDLGKTLLLKATIGTCLLAASSLAAAFDFTHQSSKIVPNHESCDAHDSSTTLRATYAFRNSNGTTGIWCLRYKGRYTRNIYNSLSNTPVGSIDLTTSNDAVMTSVRFWLSAPSCGRSPCGWVSNLDGWQTNNWTGTRKSYYSVLGLSGGWDLPALSATPQFGGTPGLTVPSVSFNNSSGGIRSVRFYAVNGTE